MSELKKKNKKNQKKQSSSHNNIFSYLIFEKTISLHNIHLNNHILVNNFLKTLVIKQISLVIMQCLEKKKFHNYNVK